jgi:adenylate cyclase
MENFASRNFRPIIYSAVLALLVFGCVGFLWIGGFLQQSELWFYDNFTAEASNPKAEDNRISLVLLDEKDIESYDYPLRDQLLSVLLEKIESGHPALIGIDLYRDLPEPRNGSEASILNQTLTRYPNIIGIFLFGTEKQPFRIPPPAALRQDLSRCGFNDFPIDYKTVRRAFLYLPDSCDYASFACLLAQNYLANEKGITPTTDGPYMRIGKTTFRRFRSNDSGYVNAADGGYQFMLDFRGPRTFTTRSISETLKLPSADVFKDQIVIIGGGSDSARDAVDTPIGEGVPGPMVHAQIVNQILRAALNGDQSRGTFTPPVKWLWAFFWCVAGCLSGFCLRSHILYGFATVAGVAAVIGSAWLLFLAGWWVPVVAPGLAFMLTSVSVKSYTAYYGEQQRANLMKLFSQHVAPDVAEMLWDERDKFLQGGRPSAQRLSATVLFTDLQGYSTMSEKLSPQELMDWVNECLGSLAQHVGKNGGIINKYIGDAIMAVFGIPVPRTTPAQIAHDARNAVTCAVEMAEEISRLNRQWLAQGKSAARMRIGIHTGELMAGVLGSEDRLEYTVIGDAVNISARLEGVDKENKMSGGLSEECRILISESTFVYVTDDFIFEQLGYEALKGREEKTLIYKVLARKNNGGTNIA